MQSKLLSGFPRNKFCNLFIFIFKFKQIDEIDKFDKPSTKSYRHSYNLGIPKTTFSSTPFNSFKKIQHHGQKIANYMALNETFRIKGILVYGNI